MNNIKEFILNPKEFFNDERKFKLAPLTLVFFILSIASVFIESNSLKSSLDQITKSLGLPEYAMPLIIAIFGSLSILLGMVIVVNIVYLITKFFVKIVEGREIEDKKYFKKLFYLRYLTTNIIIVIMTIIIGLIVKNTKTVAIISSVNSIFIGLITQYILYNILKFYVKTEKLHKILPVIFYILITISQVISIHTAITQNLPM